MQEALFWQSEPELKAKCLLCPHECLITEGKTGICRVRENRKGKLYSLVYGFPAALHSDPVEKKPLYHFYPGSQILSVGTFGCNFRCSFCQNHHLSQSGIEPGYHKEVLPEAMAQHAIRLKGNIGMAYTYSEPTIFYEYMFDTAVFVKSAGLKNVVISNGYISEGPLEKLLNVTDAFNIDLKSFNNDFYRKLTGGTIGPVLRTLRSIVKAGKHLEVTHLVIPGMNDDAGEFAKMVNWLSEELGQDIPLHLSRYFPSWKLTQPPTPVETLHLFTRLAKEKLHYIYTGNVGTGEFSSTRCPDCNELLILRQGYQTRISGLACDGKCGRCGKTIPVRI